MHICENILDPKVQLVENAETNLLSEAPDHGDVKTVEITILLVKNRIITLHYRSGHMEILLLVAQLQSFAEESSQW